MGQMQIYLILFYICTKSRKVMRKRVLCIYIQLLLILSALSAGAQRPASLPQASQFVVDSLAPDLMSYMVRSPFPAARVETALAAYEPLGSSQYQYLAKLEKTHDGVIADSTLTAMLEGARTVIGKRAIIICGDIDIKRTQDSLKVFAARMVKSDSLAFMRPDRHLPEIGSAKGPRIIERPCSIVLTGGRLSKEDIGGTTARVSARYSNWLGAEYVRRCRRALREAGIASGNVGYDYYPSYSHGGDETIVAYASVADEDIEKAKQVMRLSLLGTADGGYRNWPPADDVADLRSPMERCTDAFLYGADLASDETVADWFRKHSLGKKEIEYFKAFAKEFVSGLSHAAAVSDPQWFSKLPLMMEKPDMADTSRLNLPISKVKLKNDDADKLTGGIQWTFNNGMKVLYKEMKTGGRMEYSIIFNGGATEFLSERELPFAWDILRCGRLGGMNGNDFMDMIEAWGVTMEIEAGISETTIKGHVEDSNLDKLLRVLNVVANSRRPADTESFERLRKNLVLAEKDWRESREGLEAAMDSIMSPDFAFSGRMTASLLKDDLPQRVEQYFSSCFDRFDDSMMILIGDLPSDRAKRMLTRHLGMFGTGGDPAPRSSVSWIPKSGSSEAAGMDAAAVEEGSIHIEITTAANYSRQRQIALEAAGAIIRDSLEYALAGSGYRIEMNSRLDIRPVERIVMNIHCTAISENAMAPREVLAIIEALIDEAASVKETRIDGFKDSKTAEIQKSTKDADSLMKVAVARYGLGKDILGSAAQVKSLRWVDIKNVLTMIQDAPRLVLVDERQ